MNKNVLHNGKSYPKDTEIKQGDSGFEELVEKGHATVVVFRNGDEAMNETHATTEPAEMFPIDEPAPTPHHAPAKKKKH